MRIAAITFVPLCVFAVSCGGSAPQTPVSGAPPATTAAAPSLPSNIDVIAKVYDPFYGTPDGFFVDARAGTAQSYTVHHVMDDSLSFEVCTDDFQTAEAWEAADNASRSVNGYYVGSIETDRYFEFIRELSYDDDVGNIDDLTSPGFARVFKCSNTNRNGVDRALLSGYAGALNSRPLGPDSTREYVEYFWQFTFFPQRYKKVLASYPGAEPNSRTLLLGFATTQGNNRCDRIEVAEWRFVADASTGEIQSQFEILRTFEAQLVDGSPLICE